MQPFCLVAQYSTPTNNNWSHLNQIPLLIWANHNYCSTFGNFFALNLLFFHIRSTEQWFPPKIPRENIFWAIQSTVKSLEMHSKWRYKICISSVIQRQLEHLQKIQRLSIISQKSLDVILSFTFNSNHDH